MSPGRDIVQEKIPATKKRVRVERYLIKSFFKL